MRCNPEFDDYIDKLSDSSALMAIKEAYDILNSGQTYENQSISVGACLVISLILQWTVRYLCKTLMQVMTPEAIVTFHKRIPSSYVANYLEHQQHFNLGKLIAVYYKAALSFKRSVF